MAYTMSRRISFSFCLTFLMMVSRPMLASHPKKMADDLQEAGWMAVLLSLSRYRVLLHDSVQEFTSTSHFLLAGAAFATAKLKKTFDPMREKGKEGHSLQHLCTFVHHGRSMHNFLG